jgi:hypothetical protein
MESQFVQTEQMDRQHDGFYNNTDNQIKKFEKSRPPTCFGGDVMSPWTRTPLYDERYFPQYSKISDFMEGLALRKPHPSAAVCEYRDIKFWRHFPHGYVLKSRDKLASAGRLNVSFLFLGCNSYIVVRLGGLPIQPSNRFSFLREKMDFTKEIL